jgi:hypothetical protein
MVANGSLNLVDKKHSFRGSSKLGKCEYEVQCAADGDSAK